MGLLNMLFSSHQQTARDLFDNFLNEERSYKIMAKQYNNKFALANYHEFVAHLNKIHDMFCTELRLIKEPITFRGYDFCYTSSQAVKHMEDFIMEIFDLHRGRKIVERCVRIIDNNQIHQSVL